MPLRLDYTNMMAPAIAGGVTDAEWRGIGARFAEAHAAVVGLHGAGTLGFLDLPDDRELHRATQEYVARVRRRSGGDALADVVVLGIGGSALGPIALRAALRPPQWNLLDDAAGEGRPRLQVLDNVDPANIDALLG